MIFSKVDIVYKEDYSRNDLITKIIKQLGEMVPETHVKQNLGRKILHLIGDKLEGSKMILSDHI